MFAAAGSTNELLQYWQYFLLVLNLSIAVTASSHAILWKRDSRSALIWVSLIWFLPLLGSFLYSILGINRIKRRAAILRSDRLTVDSQPTAKPCSPSQINQRIGNDNTSTDLCAIATTIGNISKQPLLPGNRIEPLVNGDETFPAMRKAIASAKKSITLSTYIFDLDPTGARFAYELAQAKDRGVEIRVLIDSTGARYSWPPITERLAQLRIPYARFLPSMKLVRPLTLNLHNHRKIMVVDGRIGFTGGMNIRHSNLLKENPKNPVQDLHFELRGPIVAHLQSAFAEDWAYATNERLSGEDWFPRLRGHGDILARGITDGPDEDLDKLIWSMIAGLNAATKNVWIVTPYFLPEAQLIAALNAAALRGVNVQILVPKKNNLPFMNWAMSAMLWQVISRGCKLYATPPPFDHTKLMVVDDSWSLIGSANWDARSLRLNFEFTVECYSNRLARLLRQQIESKLATAQPITLQQLENRPYLIRLRDGLTRLLSPFL
jgi:cardiolipin synthase